MITIGNRCVQKYITRKDGMFAYARCRSCLTCIATSDHRTSSFVSAEQPLRKDFYICGLVGNMG